MAPWKSRFVSRPLFNMTFKPKLPRCFPGIGIRSLCDLLIWYFLLSSRSAQELALPFSVNSWWIKQLEQNNCPAKTNLSPLKSVTFHQLPPNDQGSLPRHHSCWDCIQSTFSICPLPHSTGSHLLPPVRRSPCEAFHQFLEHILYLSDQFKIGNTEIQWAINDS